MHFAVNVFFHATKFALHTSPQDSAYAHGPLAYGRGSVDSPRARQDGTQGPDAFLKHLGSAHAASGPMLKPPNVSCNSTSTKSASAAHNAGSKKSPTPADNNKKRLKASTSDVMSAASDVLLRMQRLSIQPSNVVSAGRSASVTAGQSPKGDRSVRAAGGTAAGYSPAKYSASAHGGSHFYAAQSRPLQQRGVGAPPSPGTRSTSDLVALLSPRLLANLHSLSSACAEEAVQAQLQQWGGNVQGAPLSPHSYRKQTTSGSSSSNHHLPHPRISLPGVGPAADGAPHSPLTSQSSLLPSKSGLRSLDSFYPEPGYLTLQQQQKQQKQTQVQHAWGKALPPARRSTNSMDDYGTSRNWGGTRGRGSAKALGAAAANTSNTGICSMGSSIQGFLSAAAKVGSRP
jgi:hypothetical protein